MVEPSGWIHISLMNQVRYLYNCNNNNYNSRLPLACQGIKCSLVLNISILADERANQHLHDPDRGAGQPPERQRHSHATDQSLHAGGRKLHRKVPAMHDSRLHDVPHHQVILDSHVMLLNLCVVMGTRIMFQKGKKMRPIEVLPIITSLRFIDATVEHSLLLLLWNVAFLNKNSDSVSKLRF